MKQIRNNVFETNSSSTHAISMSGCKDNFIQPYSNNDIIEIEFGEYGWEHNSLDGYHEKLSYILTMIQYHINHKELPDDNESQEYIDAILNSKWFTWLKDMVFEYCGKHLVVNSEVVGWYPAGYIDHQSTDILDDWWSEDEKTFKENMKDIVFNDRYSIVTDNDNH